MSFIKIDQKAYEYNLEQIATKVGGFEKIICVLKDDAYGHKAKLIAPIARKMGVNFVAVKDEAEAIELESFFDNILILSHRPNSKENPKFIYALNDIKNIDKYAKNTKIHLKIDSGMHRNGVCLEDLEKALVLIRQNKLRLEGVFTHFASADELDGSFFVQKQNFKKAKELCKSHFPSLIFHSYNSAALFRADFVEDELCRIGLAQFGYADLNLKKVLSLYANKLSQRTLKKGQSLGYGFAFKASCDMEISTYDLGYADGLFRFNGKGELRLANGKLMLGKMSMDSFSCEGVSDEICVLNDANVWAEFFNTINYEILVKLHSKIPRILV